jgi:hypothetical protein
MRTTPGTRRRWRGAAGRRNGTARRTAEVVATIAVLSALTAAIRQAGRQGRREREHTMDNVTTDVGPVDLAVIGFTGNRYTGEVAPALLDLVRSGTIRVLDALFVYRDADGTVGSLEIGDLGPDLTPAFVSVDGGAGVGLLDPEDVVDVGGDLAPNTSALVLVFENAWAARFAGACRRAGGQLLDIARVPSQAVADALTPISGAGRPIGA